MRIALGVLVLGCGARSAHPGIDAPGEDAGRDTGVSTLDAGTDELDLGADSRPSDYPEADDWTDVDPSAVEGQPCCDLVGDPVELDGVQNASGEPVVAWDGSGWGVAWGSTFRQLDEEAQPIGDLVTVGSGSTYCAALEWGADRYGFAGHGRGGGIEVAMLDSGGAPIGAPGGFGNPAEHPDLTRQVHGHGWILGSLEDGEDAVARWVTDEAILSNESVVMGRPAPSRGPQVVGLASRTSVVWLEDWTGVWHRGLAWPEPTGDAVQILDMLSFEDSSLEAVAFRDWTVVAGMNGSVRISIFDPWEEELVAAGVVAESGIIDRRPRLAPVDERGYLGLCFAQGPGPAGGSGGEDGIELGLLGNDGTLWGQIIPVVEGLRNAGGCGLGWNGTDFLVVWWEAALENNRILAQRVRPRI